MPIVMQYACSDFVLQCNWQSPRRLQFDAIPGRKLKMKSHIIIMIVILYWTPLTMTED